MLITVAYNRPKALAYADTWALARHPYYLDFHGLGGDCTNFASQCVLAGSGVQNYTPLYGWYYKSAYDRAPSWTGVAFLYNFLTKNKGPGPFASETAVSKVQVGDLVQMAGEDGVYHHTPVVVEVGVPPSPDNIRVSAHTNDVSHKPLTEYEYASLRFLHLEGVRKWA